MRAVCFSYDYNFSSNQDNPNDNYDGEFRMKKNNFTYEIGVGVDFYLAYFKFSTEIKMGVGLKNMAVPDNTEFTGAMKYIKSKIFMISFHFEG